MPEIMSQNQIDTLMEELKNNKPLSETNAQQLNDNRQIKEYDFKSPKKFSKEQLKLVNSIYDSFSRHLASYFSGVLRTYCEITVEDIVERPYYEYNNALPDSVMISVMDFKTDEDVTPKLEGIMLVDISNVITFALIERLMGGEVNSVFRDREFTEIEISLVEKIFKQIAKFTKESWLDVVNINPEMKRIETNSRLMQQISMDEIVLIVIMSIDIKSVKGTLNVCIPCISLEPLLKKSKIIRYNKNNAENEQDKITKDMLLSHIMESDLDVVSKLGETKLSFTDIVNLQVGDVIKLDRKTEDSVKVNVGGKTWFYGIPGVKRNRKVIKINKVL